MEELPPLDVVLETVENVQLTSVVNPDDENNPQNDQTPVGIHSDSSSDPSLASLSSEEQSSPSGRGVLQKMRERHNHRELLLPMMTSHC